MNFQKKRPFHLVFLHLDLGIGGAEQLMINLALASLNLSTHGNQPSFRAPFSEYFGVHVSILTTHKSPSHCFDVVSKDGKLFSNLRVVGSFIPNSIFGFARALCSTIRMFYLSHMATLLYPKADVFVIDILPTPIPYLIFRGANSVIYYCHFPDKLLTTDIMTGMAIKKSTSILRAIYRLFFDLIEEWSLSFSDVICFNSNFTRDETYRVFPSLQRHMDKVTTMKVLYPAIDFGKFTPPDFVEKEHLLSRAIFHNEVSLLRCPIVSLSRFEQKKNIELLLSTYARLVPRASKYNMTLPQLIIAGGLDPNNQDNYRYFLHLQNLSKQLNIDSYISFRPNVSDKEREKLLQSALCLAYPPDKEHFGIVPLEAMYTGVPVVALCSGGLKETIVHEMTGLFVNPNDDSLVERFEDTLWMFIKDPILSIEMGRNGHEHVKEQFSWKEFKSCWMHLVKEAHKRGKSRRKKMQNRKFSLSRLEEFFIISIYSIFFQFFIQ